MKLTIDATDWALHGLDNVEWLLSAKACCVMPRLCFFMRETP